MTTHIVSHVRYHSCRNTKPPRAAVAATKNGHYSIQTILISRISFFPSFVFSLQREKINPAKKDFQKSPNHFNLSNEVRSSNHPTKDAKRYYATHASYRQGKGAGQIRNFGSEGNTKSKHTRHATGTVLQPISHHANLQGRRGLKTFA